MDKKARELLEKKKQQLLNKAFNITSVNRTDIIQAGFTERQALTVDDSDMKHIADKMADAFCNCCYWIALEELTQTILLDKKGDKGK